MKSKFRPDVDSSVRLPPTVRLIDPEAYDASEQRFAASVEQKPAPPRFVPDAVQEPSGNATAGNGASRAESDDHKSSGDRENCPPAPDPTQASGPENPGDVEPGAMSLQAELLGPQDSGAWRREVADRVTNYRARRRPRSPRYPSLQLKFDPPESSRTVCAATSQQATIPAPSRLALATQDALPVSPEQHPASPGTDDTREYLNAAETAKILEFPRSAAAPPPVLDELAEPVVARPRILEAPEFMPPPPALGGILMEPVEEPAEQRRPGFELPLQAAPLSMRLLAGAIDSLLVVSAFALFAYIFFRIASIVPPLQQAAGISAILISVLWIAYQYLLLIYTGTTPGLKVARLRLSRFDGTAVPRKIRLWRVLASMLSGLSLALGYAWCFLDEDQLCWHDRITRTYMAPQPPRSENSTSA
jgi:uncharacterized RDD family membrane protein YckC